MRIKAKIPSRPNQLQIHTNLSERNDTASNVLSDMRIAYVKIQSEARERERYRNKILKIRQRDSEVSKRERCRTEVSVATCHLGRKYIHSLKQNVNKKRLIQNIIKRINFDIERKLHALILILLDFT